MPKFISGLQEEIAYLNNLTPEQLSAWPKGVLAERTTSPILLPGQKEPDEFLMDLGLTPQIGEKSKKRSWNLYHLGMRLKKQLT